MCRALHQPFDHIGARLAPVMARPAQCHEIGNRVGLTNRPRDNVVNVKSLAFPGKRGFRLAASLARSAVARPSSFRRCGPVSAPAVMLGRSPLPLWTGRSGKSAVARGDITGVAAKLPVFASELRKGLSACGAVPAGTLNPIPAVCVIAGHGAENGAVCPICGHAEGFPAPGASLGNLCGSTIGPGAKAAIPRWSTIRSSAVMAAVFAIALAGERLSTFGAKVMDWFCHGENIARTRCNIKNFDTACRRVDEAARQPDLLIPETRPAPVQEGFL